MYATDFIYDGIKLSDMGYIVCSFDKSSSGSDTLSIGADIEFTQISMSNGRYQPMIYSEYKDCYSAEFDICKDPSKYYDDKEISDLEMRKLLRWLNKRTFSSLQIIDEDHPDKVCTFDASFNAQKIVLSERVFGLNCKMITNAPFGYRTIKTLFNSTANQAADYTLTPDMDINLSAMASGKGTINVYQVMSDGHLQNVRLDNLALISPEEISANTNDSYSFLFIDSSDEVGTSYVNAEITCNSDGNLQITNLLTGLITLVKNCKTGEVITLDSVNGIISSSISSHDIYNDFNYQFLKVENTLNTRVNPILVSLPCSMVITQKSTVKGGV